MLTSSFYMHVENGNQSQKKSNPFSINQEIMVSYMLCHEEE